jgi:F0F1-type ATP synthase assembly protein I
MTMSIKLNLLLFIVMPPVLVGVFIGAFMFIDDPVFRAADLVLIVLWLLTFAYGCLRVLPDIRELQQLKKDGDDARR